MLQTMKTADYVAGDEQRMRGTRPTQSMTVKRDIRRWHSQKNTSDWPKHAPYLAHYETYARGMTGEDQIDILIERNRNLLEQAGALVRRNTAIEG